jgi:hypothetical protein
MEIEGERTVVARDAIFSRRKSSTRSTTPVWSTALHRRTSPDE